MHGTAQLSLDGADRLYAAMLEGGEPVAADEAGRVLFALRRAPAALVRQLVDEVVRADARFAWRSASELALAEWEPIRHLAGVALERATYVVFDLETTGTSPVESRIVEIGAVRLQGLEQVASYERLVDPGRPLPAAISALTGIRPSDLRGRPRVAVALDEFLRFAAGAVLVAHNARFDVGFVDAELRRRRGVRLAAPVLDTVALARRLLGERLPRMTLGALADRYATSVRPCHRALPDACATAEVLVHLIGELQERGIGTVGEAIAFAAPPRRRVRERRGLAAGMPRGPGVYVFRARDERALYVGKAADLRTRVRSYFAAGSLRRPVEDALAATERIEARPLGSQLEAALLELELIARLAPPGNRRSVRPDRLPYLRLTVSETVPRLSVTTRPEAAGDVVVGPLPGRRAADVLARAVRLTFGLRSCRPRLPVDDGTCLAGALGRCVAPCRGGPDVDRYTAAVAAARRWLEHGHGPQPREALRRRMETLRRQLRFEEAAAVRDEAAALARAERRLATLRRARARSGVLLAADVDDRFVHAFACARGQVVARRRLPRSGDARLEIDALLTALAAALAAPRPPGCAFPAAEAEGARIVAAALARPGRDARAVPVSAETLAGARERIAARREWVPLRR